VIVGVDPDPALADDLREWTVGYWESVHPYSAGGGYVNFMMDEGQERVQATYGSNYARLARAKADGYRIITRMIPNMGYHFMNASVSGFDVSNPPILVYEHRGNGWHLGALE